MDFVGIDGTKHPFNGGFPGGAVGAQLGQHGVVVHAHVAAFLHAVVDADARPHRRAVTGQGSSAGEKATCDVLRIDPQFQGVPLDAEVRLLKRDGVAFGNADLFTHQVHTRDQFRDRVFHLQARVHLQEEELPRGVDKKFDRPCTDIIARPGHLNGTLPHRFS